MTVYRKGCNQKQMCKTVNMCHLAPFSFPCCKKLLSLDSSTHSTHPLPSPEITILSRIFTLAKIHHIMLFLHPFGSYTYIHSSVLYFPFPVSERRDFPKIPVFLAPSPLLLLREELVSQLPAAEITIWDKNLKSFFFSWLMASEVSVHGVLATHTYIIAEGQEEEIYWAHSRKEAEHKEAPGRKETFKSVSQWPPSFS